MTTLKRVTREQVEQLASDLRAGGFTASIHYASMPTDDHTISFREFESIVVKVASDDDYLVVMSEAEQDRRADYILDIPHLNPKSAGRILRALHTWDKAQRAAFDRMLRAHSREMKRRGAEQHNFGWASTDTGIASKTSEGILESEIDLKTGQITHWWTE